MITLPDNVRSVLVAGGQLVRWRSISSADGEWPPTVEVMEPPEPTEPTPLDEGVYVSTDDVAAVLRGFADSVSVKGAVIGNCGVAVKAALTAVAQSLTDLRP